MPLFNALSRRLYLRIWLAVVGGVAVLTLVVGWAWQISEEHYRAPREPREVMVRNAAGVLIGSAEAEVSRTPGQGLEFIVTLDNGQTLALQMPPRGRRPAGPPPAWTRSPFGFAWLLALVGLAVALGVYPIVRRLTQRLESLQRGVQRWGEGDLSVRVPVQGHDEVADLAARFNHAAERVETLVKSHKSLLANASHELRSPLTRIRMGLELMGSTPSAAFKDEISRNIGELDQLIDEILLASRLDAQEADIGTVEQIDLTGLAAEECARLNIELDTDSDAGADARAVTVDGVPKLLRRAIRNLIENARRYGTGAITVSVQREDQRAVLRVSDRGPGVPANLRERIFEPFYRLPGASEREGGVGLGLALVKSIAQRHHGTVRCEDRPGGGATFVVDLPSSDM
ncbi:ATP-binding protein [Polaromonas sp. C04]|uniref:ATP-binding protein n=1 Tax=Polaromonas sp. C04 TaxID=1945857 RepID=UPI0009872A6D|nr:ATP-binding protein [Polaromonas sp. C04]OOG53500.1 two-component sensor histidine kinase [Polaromonas sp. C04]